MPSQSVDLLYVFGEYKLEFKKIRCSTSTVGGRIIRDWSIPQISRYFLPIKHKLSATQLQLLLEKHTIITSDAVCSTRTFHDRSSKQDSIYYI